VHLEQLRVGLRGGLSRPINWTNQSSGKHLHLVRLTSRSEFAMLQQICNPGDKKQLGKGRDCKDPHNAGQAPQVKAAWRVENYDLWQTFAAARKRVGRQCSNLGTNVNTKLAIREDFIKPHGCFPAHVRSTRMPTRFIFCTPRLSPQYTR
jgi:hypothetical protein